MPENAADRNLLFGLLALQLDFLTRDQLFDGMNAWVLEKAKPLAQILEEKQVLAAVQRRALEPLVELHVAQHDGDPQKSLAAIASTSLILRDWILGGGIANRKRLGALPRFLSTCAGRRNADIGSHGNRGIYAMAGSRIFQFIAET